MTITEKNLRAADEIIQILIKEECTIKEATEILFEVSSGIERSSMVQVVNYQEKFKDELNH